MGLNSQAQYMGQPTAYSPSDVSYSDVNQVEEVVLEFDDPDKEDIVFELPPVPGATDQSDIIVEPIDSEIEVEEPKDVEVAEHDPWNWEASGLGSFITWIKDMLNKTPSHSGREVSGLERAQSYLAALDREITKAMRMDFDGEIESSIIENIRDEIHKGIERLEDRLEKLHASKYGKGKKKKAETADNLVKEAGTQRIGGIVITVPIFISRLARVCINGMVSAGHDIEETFSKLSKKYDLTKREQAELLQLMSDMGYAIPRDRGFDLDEEFNIASSDNMDFAAQYPD